MYILEINLNSHETFYYYFSFVNYGLGIIFAINKVLNFSRFWEMRFIHKCDVFMTLFILFTFNL